jgi:conjugative relaxase-like TrwC/TraI family protein
VPDVAAITRRWRGGQGRAVRPSHRLPRRGDLDGRDDDATIQASPEAASTGRGMLTVVKITGVQADVYADYLEAKTTPSTAGDYYLKDGERVEAPGRWIGGAEHVGEDPVVRVTGEQLRALMAVTHPVSGEPLRAAGASGEIVAALDATFSAPKSVSAVWAIADPELRAQVEQAHETAIDRTMTYASRQVAMLRQRVDRDTVIHVKPMAVIATGWRHTTSRAVNGPPDPQLHTHVLIHAGVRRDGRIVAVDSRAWFDHRRELGAAYRTELARELTGLGFEVQRGTGRGGRYFELAGIPTGLRDRWSSRHHQVREAIRSRLASRRAELKDAIARGGPEGASARQRLEVLEAGGQLPAAEDRFMAIATRATKTPATQQDLDRRWTATAEQAGVGADELHEMRRPDRAVPPASQERIRTQLTEHDATLSRSHARAIALEQSAGEPIVQALTHLAEMRDRHELLELDDRSWTTKSHRDQERATEALTIRLAAGDSEPIPRVLVDNHLERLDQELIAIGSRLSDEQDAAMRLASSDAQLVVIEGQAGTGKSTVLTGVARAHEEAGQEVVVTSTAALAAQRLADDLTSAGTHPRAYSTVGLAQAIDSGRLILDPSVTVIHDEAALASTRELHRLLRDVDGSGARLILVGDPRQSHPVGASGMWPTIHAASTDQDAHASLTLNLRARHAEDADAQARFRDGDHLGALHNYAERNRLHLHRDTQDAEDSALEAAHGDRAAGRQTLIITQTSNDHLDELNARAQAIRREHGELGAEKLPLPGRPYDLSPGDEIQLRSSISHPEHGLLRNGTTADVVDIDPNRHSAQLRLGDGRHVDLAAEDIHQADVRLGYVQHPFLAQGTTTDSTHVIIADHPTQEGTYVGLTRAREHTHVYAATAELDPAREALPQLAERVAQTDDDVPSLAHELAGTRGATGATSGDQRLDAVAAYRQRYAIPDHDSRPLGPEPPAGAFAQRLERRQAARDAIDSAPDDLSPELRDRLRDVRDGRSAEPLGMEPGP